MLPGDTLFVQASTCLGKALTALPNGRPMSRAARGAPDLVGYVNFYGGLPASALDKLRDGTRRLLRSA
jgi:hypothetical protein